MYWTGAQYQTNAMPDTSYGQIKQRMYFHTVTRLQQAQEGMAKTKKGCWTRNQQSRIYVQITPVTCYQ